MKKKNYLWSVLTVMMAAMLSMGLSSCSDDPKLNVSGTVINVEANGTVSNEIIVTAEETDWSVSVTSGGEWLSAYKNGNKVGINAKENTGTSERYGSLLVSATEDASLSHIINVTQKGTSAFITINGSTTAEYTFPGGFSSGKSGIDYKQVFKIKSNVQWNLSGKEDWLNVSSTSGNGDVDLSIYPTSENPLETERTATLTLSASDVSPVTITIIQKLDESKSNCYVLPANEVALWDRMCYEYSATSNVNTFQCIVLSESEFRRMADYELENEVRKEEEFKYIDQYITYRGSDSHGNAITQNTTYYIVTLARDMNGKYGRLKKTTIKTPGYLDADKDAWVSFSDLSYYSNWGGFSFYANKEGYCNTYHLIYGLYTGSVNPVVHAFEINYYLKYKRKHWFAENWGWEIVTDYPNSHSFTYYSTSLPSELRPYVSAIPWCFASGWGVFKDGRISSDLIGFQVDLTDYMNSSSRIFKNIRASDNKIQVQTIRRSVEQEKARNLRK